MRQLVSRQAGGTVGDDIGSEQGSSWLQHHHGAPDFTPSLVRYTNDGSLGDGFMLVQHVFHLRRIYVLATRDVHILPAIDDEVVAFLVDHGGIARMQPAVCEGC